MALLMINYIYIYIYHTILFWYYHIEYTQWPIMRGKIQIINSGKCIFGKRVVFNNRLTSNFVGLFKPCTICVEKTGYLEIGDYSGFSGVSIYCSNKIIFGKYINCGGNVSIWDTDFHPLDFEDRRVNDSSKVNSAPILIDDDVFIGANSIILKGVSIGARSIIGAGSVVTKNIPSDEIWAGNPARFIMKVRERERKKN